MLGVPIGTASVGRSKYGRPLPCGIPGTDGVESRRAGPSSNWSAKERLFFATARGASLAPFLRLLN